MALQTVMRQHARITPTAAFNLLLTSGAPNALMYKNAIKNYIGNHPPETKLGHVLGVSSFGTCEAICADKLGCDECGLVEAGRDH